MTLHGPPGLDVFFHATRHFMYRTELGVKVVCAGPGVSFCLPAPVPGSRILRPIDRSTTVALDVRVGSLGPVLGGGRADRRSFCSGTKQRFDCVYSRFTYDEP